MTRKTWCTVQSECQDLHRVHAHFSQGTHPSKKLNVLHDTATEVTESLLSEYEPDTTSMVTGSLQALDVPDTSSVAAESQQ